MVVPSRTLRTDIAWSKAEGVYIHGYSLCDDLLGHVSFGDMAFLAICGRLPTGGESKMFNAVLITFVEHGVVPSTLAARMTYAGAPEAMQAAVAAGLLGLGSVFVGSTEGAARMLTTSLIDKEGICAPDLARKAQDIVRAHKSQRRTIPGLGHPVHKPVDPRTTRLFDIARETGFHGDYVALINAVGDAAAREFQKPMPVNATGAVGAICCEMGLEWRVTRGLGVMARAVGLVGHVLEESRQPMALELWRRAEEEATQHLRSAVGNDGRSDL